jgi:5-methyltetrahydropteroyltriglutamate--homocysteine methyltransferase
MHRSDNRLLTTHVGSLIRPPQLVELLRQRESGEHIDDPIFAQCLEASVADVARAQADIGLDIINDGEFGKTISWSRYVVERLSGVVRQTTDRESMPAGIVGKD